MKTNHRRGFVAGRPRVPLRKLTFMAMAKYARRQAFAFPGCFGGKRRFARQVRGAKAWLRALDRRHLNDRRNWDTEEATRGEA